MMKNKIFHNLGLKILALLIATMVWWVVMNIDDPLQKKTITGIVVELRNTEELTQKGYIYEVNSGSTISITVSAPKSVINDLKASDFVAYADMSQLSPLTDSADIEVECVKADVKGDIKEITPRTKVVKLTIDNKATVEVPVSTDITGNPAADYVMGDIFLSQYQIQVTGAASTVDTISKAVVSYDVSDTTVSVDERVTPVFYDEEGRVVDISGLELSRSSLRLTVDILPTKWINVNVVPSGTPADGYKLTGYTTNIEQIKIAGSRNNLANISAVNIPSDAVVVDGLKESTDIPVNIANYLSGAYSIVSDTNELVVHLDIEELITESYTIPCGAIRIYNLADTLKMEFEDTSVEIRIKAIKDVHDTFNMDALNASIDLQGLGEGEYNIILGLSEDSNNFDVIGTYMVPVVITGPDSGTESEEETSEAGTGSGKR